jgi:hypothetical protein
MSRTCRSRAGTFGGSDDRRCTQRSIKSADPIPSSGSPLGSEILPPRLQRDYNSRRKHANNGQGREDRCRSRQLLIMGDERWEASAWTFNPKVAGSRPARPTNNVIATPRLKRRLSAFGGCPLRYPGTECLDPRLCRSRRSPRSSPRRYRKRWRRLSAFGHPAARKERL